METQSGISAAPPRITQLLGSNGENIAEGGSSNSASVTLKGTAEFTTVEVFDRENFIVRTSASSGTWAQSVNGLGAGEHVFTARSYDGQLISNEWRYTVNLSPVFGFEDFESFQGQNNDQITSVPVTFPSGLSVRLASDNPAGRYGYFGYYSLPNRPIYRWYVAVGGGAIVRFDFGGSIVRLKLSYWTEGSYAPVKLIFKKVGVPDYVYPVPNDRFEDADITLPGPMDWLEVYTAPKTGILGSSIGVDNFQWS